MKKASQNNKLVNDRIKILFKELCEEYGIKRKEETSISSKVDSSVFFVGAGISLFKSDIFSTVPNNYVLQPCFRSHNLSHFSKPFDFSYSSFFVSPCIVAPSNSFKNILLLIIRLHQNISKLTLQIDVYYGDRELLEQINFLKSYGVKISIDLSNLNSYRHSYGDTRLNGKTINFRIAYDNQTTSRIFANVSLIKIDGVEKILDFGTGLSTYISCLMQLSHSIKSDLISDLHEIRTTTDVIFCDSLTAVYEIAYAGVKPLSNKRGRILRQYLKVLADTAVNLNINTSEILNLFRQYEYHTNKQKSQIPFFISEYLDIYIQKKNSAANINKLLSEKSSWYKQEIR